MDHTDCGGWTIQAVGVFHTAVGVFHTDVGAFHTGTEGFLITTIYLKNIH